MSREYFMTSERIGFSSWQAEDLPLAQLLWGDADVTKYICASGQFSRQDIADRLNREIENASLHGVQYWPIFHLERGDLIGCCGLRPHGQNCYELGFHLRPLYWQQGYASEAASKVIDHAFTMKKAQKLFAGHNPKNEASRHVLAKLGFCLIGEEFYEPTGLYHPSYELLKK